ncbi:MAG: FG-GAP repeat protein [Planctomycetes bacterium]|nr:FG-GAP repeat protein [Planctomycetota bacterium]
MWFRPASHRPPARSFGSWLALPALIACGAPLGIAQQTELARLFPSDPGNGDSFGRAVAISGDVAIVGSISDDHGGVSDAGSAYVFGRAGTSWTEQQKLVASDAATSDAFGGSVALSGDTLIVGAERCDVSGIADAGAAYVFVRSGGVWTQQQKLVANDAVAGDNFGWSVAISGETVVVGARQADPQGLVDAGAAYVFVRSGATWSLQQKLVASDARASDRFGNVAIDGDRVVVGASFSTVLGLTGAGAAYVYLRSGGTWVEEQKLVAVTPGTTTFFGTSVGISGDAILVGAPSEANAGVSQVGVLHCFERVGAAWVQQQRLIASDAIFLTNFGSPIAMSGGEAIVGAYGGFTGRGTGYHLRRVGSSWTEVTRLVTSSGVLGTAFATAVAFDGVHALLGESGARTPLNVRAGSALIYEVGGVAPPVNDECAGATPVVIGDNGPFDSAGASFAAPGFTCTPIGGSDVWHSWTAEGDGNAVIETCGASFDTIVEVYWGPCGALQSLACSDDDCGLQSRAGLLVARGTTYTIRVGGTLGATGSYTLRVSLTGEMGSFSTVATGCSGLTLTPSGAPTIGGTVRYELSAIAGTPYLWFGAPQAPLLLCPPNPCALGAEIVIAGSSTFAELQVPLDLSILGGVLACQGADFEMLAGSCPLGESFTVRLSDTVLTTIL